MANRQLSGVVDQEAGELVRRGGGRGRRTGVVGVGQPWREVVIGSFEELLERVPRAKLDWRYHMPGAREILAGYWRFVSVTKRRPTRKEMCERLPRWSEYFRSFRELEEVTRKGKRAEEAAKTKERGGVCGVALLGEAMVSEPVNEQGVVLLFGQMAKELGFVVERIRTGYPDCIAARKVGGEWKTVRIEFEFLASRFDHDPAGCDLVVCWENDWEGCPVEVLSLAERAKVSNGQRAKFGMGGAGGGGKAPKFQIAKGSNGEVRNSE